MALTEGQKKWQQTYRGKIKQINILFQPDVFDLFEWIHCQDEDMSTYIKELIRKDRDEKLGIK